MPVLKVKKNGVWEEIMGGSDSGSLNGGNADTLDGYHATHFATASNVATLEAKVGNKSVSEQINSAISNMSSSSHTHNTATTSSSGFMSSTDKSRLDSVYTAVNNHDIDISDLKTKVGNSAVSEQINTAISNISTSKTLLQHFTEEEMVLTSLQYGDTLPAPGTPGRIFFKKVNS